MSQKEMIKRHLDEGGTLTPLDSLSLFGCMALSQRIGELERRENYPIERKMVKTPSGKHVMSYKKGKRDLLSRVFG